jgi:hypothetical protein
MENAAQVTARLRRIDKCAMDDTMATYRWSGAHVHQQTNMLCLMSATWPQTVRHLYTQLRRCTYNPSHQEDEIHQTNSTVAAACSPAPPPQLTSLRACLGCACAASRLCCLDGAARGCARLLVPVDELVVLRQRLLGTGRRVWSAGKGSTEQQARYTTGVKCIVVTAAAYLLKKFGGHACSWQLYETHS